MSAGKRGRPSIAVGSRGAILPKRPKQRGAEWTCRVRYRDLQGRRHEFNASGKTRQECEDNAAAKWVALKGELELADGRSTTSMRVVVERWLESLELQVKHEKLAPGTVRQYRNCWKGTLGPLLDDLDVNELTRVQVQTLLHYGLFRRDAKGQYVLDAEGNRIPLQGQQARRVLNSVLNFAADFGYRRDGMSPLYGTREPARAPRPERYERVLSDQDWKALLTMARTAAGQPRATPHLYRTLVIIRYTGIRIGEALGLTVGKVDLLADPPRIKVNAKLPESYRIGNSRPLEPTKSSDSRIIITANELQEVLIEILANRDGAAADDPLVATRNGTFVTHANLRTMLRKLVRGTDLDWVHPHALRRTYLTAANELFGPDAAADLAGHEDKVTTQRHYIVSDGVKVLDPREMFAARGEGSPEDGDPEGGANSVVRAAS